MHSCKLYWNKWVSRGMVVAGLLVAASTIGCGGATPVAESSSSTQQTAVPAKDQPPKEQTPESVVSEFLDGVRRGGDAENVARLMTKKSRAEYEAAGLVMQPVGAPDATFEVLRSIPCDELPGCVLVSSLWTEKIPTGETMTYEVGWALRKEPEGWRVSGLILDEQPEPRVFNFENREDVLLLKSMQDYDEVAEETPASPGQQTANQPNFQMPDLR